MATESIAWPTPQPVSRPLVDALHEWVTTVDHKRLGILYIVYALLFLVFGGVEATIMRIQLIRPHNTFVSPEVFNRMFTMHGTTMIFFAAMPLVFGFANYLVPLMIGARDMAFPRLNAFSFWMTAFGGLLLYYSFVGGDGLYGAGNAPDVGWFAYAPLTSQTFSAGHSTDFWILALLVSGFGSVGTAINIIASDRVHALPRDDSGENATAGMDESSPWRDWSSWPSVRSHGQAQVMLLVDRYLGGHFFDTQAGGSGCDLDALLLDFWPSGSVRPGNPGLRLRLRNYPGLFPQGDLRLSDHGRGDGLHRIHLHERVGAPHVHGRHELGGEHVLCALSTMAIAVPTGIKIFNWLAARHVGRPDFHQDAYAVLHRVPVPVPDRGFNRSHVERGAFQLAAFRFVLRGGALSLCDCRRDSVHQFLERFTIGFRRCPAGCTTKLWVSCISGYF